MNTIESCMVECPIVQNLDENVRAQLLEQHRHECLQRRLGQLGMLCGIPHGEAKNDLTKAAIEASRQRTLVTV